MTRLRMYPRDSAMHGAIEIRCFGGWLVVFPPVRAFGIRQQWRAYWSPNATPWHHGMVPLFRSRRPVDCSCEESTCPIPRYNAYDSEVEPL